MAKKEEQEARLQADIARAAKAFVHAVNMRGHLVPASGLREFKMEAAYVALSAGVARLEAWGRRRAQPLKDEICRIAEESSDHVRAAMTLSEAERRAAELCQGCVRPTDAGYKRALELSLAILQQAVGERRAKIMKKRG